MREPPRFKRWYAGWLSALCAVFFLLTSAQGQSADELTEVSYIYSAVMGSGTYKIGDRRISVLRVPFAWTQQEVTEEQVGIKWHLPVVLGYDALNYPDWLSRFLEDELVTLTVLPGFEVKQHLTEYWVFKPFGNLGAGYDFARNETILMGVLGIRGLGTWKMGDASELRLGTSYRFAAEYQLQSARHTSFSMMEGGVDYRRDAYLKLFSRKTNAGVYYRFQLFLPKWRFGQQEDGREAEVELLHEVGVSVGLQRPFSILGIPISRVRTGFNFGDTVQGWSIGTEFPF